MKNDIIVAQTVCHGGHSHKLYYYENTKLFRCYTQCNDGYFDLFQLLMKVNSGHKDYSLPNAVNYVRISIVVNRSILTTVLLRIKGISCLILPHFAKSVVFRVKNLGSQNLAKHGISRHFEIGENYD